MTPYYDHAGIQIYHCDCREMLDSVDCDMVNTDPPYDVDADVWDGPVPYELLDTFLRISSGPVTWFGAAPKMSASLRAFSAEPRVLIWAPSFTLSHTVANGVAYRYHPIYSWRLPLKHAGPTWDVLTEPTECGNSWKHRGTKPLALIRRLCMFCRPGGRILDPFMGSGTALVAARDLGIEAIGIDADEQSCEIAAHRLDQQVLPFEREGAGSEKAPWLTREQVSPT